MAKKGSKKAKSGDSLAVVGRSVSKLVSAEAASEMEILNTPVMSARRDDDSHDDDDASDEDDDEEEIERRLVEEMQSKAAAETSAIYNKDAMLRLANELDLKQKFAWTETLDTCKVPLELSNAHDDLKREVAFYNQTLGSVKDAKARLLKEKLPYKRPDDYFAEMLKSDAHMARVKDKLIYEQKKIAAVEERKKSQAHKKVAKELQTQKTKQRLQEKNDTLDAVKQWKKRKNTNNSGGTVVEDDDGSFDKMLDGAANKRKRDGDDGRDAKRPKVNKKREVANKKWGSGGKTRADKKNSKKSTNDMSSFSRSRNNEGVGKRNAAPKGGKRPGKMARSKTNQKRGRN